MRKRITHKDYELLKQHDLDELGVIRSTDRKTLILSDSLKKIASAEKKIEKVNLHHDNY